MSGTEAVVGLAAWILRGAPSGFRARYAEEYLEIVRARMSDASRRGRVAAVHVAGREALGTVRLVARLRMGLDRPVEPGMTKRTGEGASMLETIVHDVRQAARMLSRNPGFTTTAIGVLALGIGANTAIFSAANAFFFRPLPFADADRLVLLFETNPEFGWTDVQAAPANAFDWQEQVDAFADVAQYRDIGVAKVAIQRDGEPLVVGGTTVTGNFFSVLGVEAHLGRVFRAEETWAGANAVAVLSHDLWAREFGADPGIIGSRIPLPGAATDVEIVGVMPPGFSFPGDDTELWYPYGWEATARQEVSFRRAHYTRAVARLQDGVTLAEADAQLQVVVSRLQNEYPETNSVMGAGFMPLRDFLVRGVRTPLMVLLGAVLLLLLLACANVANLMLVRANTRTREVALRHALGAGRGRVARQLFTESLLLALIGGGGGLLLGWLGVRAMGTMTRLGIDGATGIELDGRVVAFTLLTAGASGLLFGAIPVLRSSSMELQSALRDGSRGQSSGRRAVRASGVLVSVEVALALLLVVGAGLMVRSSWLLRRVDPGFQVDGALAVDVSIPSARYENRDDVLAFWDRFIEGLEGRPGIERAGVVGQLPLAGRSWSSQFQAEGWPAERVGLEILHRRADEGYFEALGIPLIRGRLFESTDGPDDPLVVVVNETFAREHFPGEDPLGQKIAYDRSPTPESYWYEIVGIVGDQHQEGLSMEARAEVFESRNQDWSRQAWVVMKTDVDPVSVLPTVRGVLAELDSRIPIVEARPLREVWSASMEREDFTLTLLAAFGITALLLATVGVYGVTAQAARGRTQEIGIRMALGASAPNVVGLMLRQGLGVVVVGLAAGLGLSLAGTRVLDSMLYGIEPNDPGTLVAVVSLLGAVALLACYVPARRATAVDPVSSLRSE